MKRICSLLFFALAFCLQSAYAQTFDPIKWEHELKKLSDTDYEIVFTATIAKGWHLYSTDIPDGGPVPTTFNVDEAAGLELVGTLQPRGKTVTVYEDVFGMDLTFFEDKGQFVQKLKATASQFSIAGYLNYMSCNDENCLPPTNVEFEYSGTAPAVAGKAAKETVPEAQAPGGEEASALAVCPDAGAAESLVSDQDEAAADNQDGLEAKPGNSDWAPVIEELSAYDSADGGDGMSLIYVFIAGFIGGLLALFTPCVWPIIPMTVSFFLKRSQDKRKGIKDASIYGVSIIVIYVALGLVVTSIFGASALNELSTNAVFNIFFFLLLVVFAASFFGAFEITLPSSWSNKVDSKAESTTGLLSIFLMAFTLALVSFSCTGPIIGFLLVEVSTLGNIIAPAVGMFGFALALALPFTLFAMFPSWLKSMPKSGGWMNSVKVVLGFLELALALKFLSVADLAYGWGILDRETFLSLWIAIFALLGLYLLGKIKFPHDDDSNKVGVTRFFLATISIAFAIYMVPGLWGAPLKAISAFSPPMNTQDFSLYEHEVEAAYHDYDEGMAAARRMGKPVMIDFTGFGCVNCRKMEAAVWTDERVRGIMTDDYVLIGLYVDDRTPLPEKEIVEENGKKLTLRTVGEKWSYLQRHKFGANAQPFYVLLDNEGKPLNGSYSYDENIDKYLDFLRTGLRNYSKR